MIIRRAQEKDIPSIEDLLSQVLEVHHKARPDLFKSNARKYKRQELEALITMDERPIFVYEDEEGIVRGYAFCVLDQHPNNNILTDIKTLYIDDLCVDQSFRGHHVGTKLYEYVKSYAGSIGCYNVTLNVWEGNPDAIRFYKAKGLRPYKYGMEEIL